LEVRIVDLLPILVGEEVLPSHARLTAVQAFVGAAIESAQARVVYAWGTALIWENRQYVS
jgi:xanthosine utilization system XapX-like protein